MAISVNGTATYARFDLLKMQVMDFFRKAANPSTSDQSSVSKGLDEKYIEKITVSGLNSSGQKCAELRMCIDWRLHSVSVQAGGGRIQAPSYWTGGFNPSIDDAIGFFQKVCANEGLTRKWLVYYSSKSDGSRINSELGLVPSSEAPWVAGPVGGKVRFDPLTEITLESLVDSTIADKKYR